MLKREGIQILYMQDIILFPFFLILTLLFAIIYRNIVYRDTKDSKYFIPGLAAKIIGGISMGLVYLYYYEGGDTFYYYYDSQTFNIALERSFGTFLNLLILPAKTITSDTYENTWWLVFFRDQSGWTADKVYGILSVLSFHSYPVMTLLIAALSFTGAWALYRTFTDKYPGLNKQLALATLFVPSVFFWGSGILKDSITFGCLGWMTYASYLIFFKGRKIIRNAIILLVTAYLAILIKPYIVISFIPALLFWIFFNYRSRIRNQFLRVVVGPGIFAVSLLFGFLMVRKLGEEFKKYSLQNLKQTAQDFHSWHSYLAETTHASGYTLGEFDGTLLSLITKIPQAVNVALFRPYLWEVNNIVMLAAAIESTFILGFTIYILIRNGFTRTIRAAFTNPTLFFCFFFSIAFAFAVGFTSYNFGALVRYKIPCIPFFLVGLIILNYETGLLRRKKRAEKQLMHERYLQRIKRRNLQPETYS